MEEQIILIVFECPFRNLIQDRQTSKLPLCDVVFHENNSMYYLLELNETKSFYICTINQLQMFHGFIDITLPLPLEKHIIMLILGSEETRVNGEKERKVSEK